MIWEDDYGNMFEVDGYDGHVSIRYYPGDLSVPICTLRIKNDDAKILADAILEYVKEYNA